MVRLSTLFLAAGLCVPAAAHAVEARAPAARGAKKQDEGPAPKAGISGILGTLDWGANHQQVLDHVKADIDKKYEDELKQVVDALAIDRILRRKADEFASIKKTFVRFTGQRTGYETSLVANDFAQNNDESMLRADDESAQRYYFFKNDRLWKVVVAYNTSVSRNVPFADFVKQVQGKYGEPEAVERHTPPGGQPTPRAATWQDEITHLSVEDRTGFFGTFVMKFVDKSEGLAIEQARTGKEVAAAPPAVAPAMEDALGDIMQDDGGSSDDVVDRLTGVTHEVDLQSGRPAYEPLRRAEAPPPQASPRKDAKPKKRAPAGRKAAEPAPAAPPAEPVIIY